MASPPAAEADQDAALDLRAAVAALPARQRAALVLRFYCACLVIRASHLASGYELFAAFQRNNSPIAVG